MNFFVMSDIDVHQLNLRPFKILYFLVENPFKKCVFLQFLNNKCIINYYFWEKTVILRKREDFISGHCIFFLFSLVW
jgi:hypothetical protein